MMSDYVFAENDCKRSLQLKGPPELGSINMDSHNCQRYTTQEQYKQNEGTIQVCSGGAYLIKHNQILDNDKK